jgi:diketogulonate reductase-like aldo/keto reductase
MVEQAGFTDVTIQYVSRAGDTRGADLDAEDVTALADEHGATASQTVLGRHLGLDNIVIPKTTRSPREECRGQFSPRWTP